MRSQAASLRSWHLRTPKEYEKSRPRSRQAALASFSWCLRSQVALAFPSSEAKISRTRHQAEIWKPSGRGSLSSLCLLDSGTYTAFPFSTHSARPRTFSSGSCCLWT